MFRKVLIANRGEIALRVIRACRELGIETVAVYSEADRESLHVRFADDDVCIGPPPARESYLNIPRLIAAAEITGADAIHPGYGFLADEALGLATEIGFPVIIKAAAGGGGKGMRVARDPEDFGRSFQLARSEALSAFGNGDVYVEKYLTRPRHIEFQILGDKFGNVIHVGERDCSVQRRHQKLVEEAPCPVMTPELRLRMGDAAVRGAKAINYVGAGTIEMLLNADGSFFFMEMNTRIQVEHPVTEMLTGVDLLKEQIRVSAGERLSVDGLPPLRGHVIEVRVNAEDPARNFQPSPGRIDVYHPPGGPGVRLDSHIYAGYTVPPYYDSLLAKVICQGRDRPEAIRRMQIALESFILEGVTTTIPFLGRVMQNSRFQAGQVDTKFLERESDLL